MTSNIARVRSRLTYANVMSTIAVFLAMGGVSYAAIVITGTNVRNGTLTGADLKDSSVTSVDVANGTIGLPDMSAGARSAVTMDSEGVAWARLREVPGGFADGVDNDTDTDTNTTYSAGSGLALDGTTFAADTTYVQRRVSSSCTAGQSIRAIAVDGTVTCEADDAASVSAGFGIVLDGNTVLVNGSVVTLDSDAIDWGRMTGVPGGFADGFDNDTTYTAGAGLTLTGTTFAANTAALQARISQACGAGQFMRSVAADGVPTCANDSNTTYTGSQGVLLSGSTFMADTSFVQRRISSACNPGSSIRAIDQFGGIVCEADDDTNTSYGAGEGLSLTGTTFAANTAYLQRRIGSACTHGIRQVNVDGSVVCSAPASAAVSNSTDVPLDMATGGFVTAATTTITTASSGYVDVTAHLTFSNDAESASEEVSCTAGGGNSFVGGTQTASFPASAISETRYQSVSCGGRVYVNGPGTHTVYVTASTSYLAAGIVLTQADLHATEVA